MPFPFCLSDRLPEPPMSFVHLHTHTHFSMLDATIRIGDLVARAKEDGVGTIALTDHDNMFGAVDFYKAARKGEIKPILGTELSPAFEAPRPGDVKHSQADTTRIRNLLGFRPVADFEEGLRRTVAWFRSSWKLS